MHGSGRVKICVNFGRLGQVGSQVVEVYFCLLENLSAYTDQITSPCYVNFTMFNFAVHYIIEYKCNHGGCSCCILKIQLMALS